MPVICREKIGAKRGKKKRGGKYTRPTVGMVCRHMPSAGASGTEGENVEIMVPGHECGEIDRLA